MKKLLTLFALVLFTYTKAQTNVYHPFPNTYGDWYMAETHYPVGCGTCGTQSYYYMYYVSGDTLVNSVNYKKVNYSLGNYPEPPLNQIFTGGSYNFAYRNDSANKKVYILPLNSAVEKLWYDFNLNIGDTLKNTYSTGGATPFPYQIISTIDSVLICNNYYKRFTCSCSQSSPFGPIYLTEGIGFSTNFFNESLSDNCQFEPYTLCTTDAWSLDACPNGLGIKNNISTNTIVLFPNPAKNNFTIEINTNEKQMLNIFDVNGKQVLQQTITGTTNIDASNLSVGVYNLSITSDAGMANKRLVIVK